MGARQHQKRTEDPRKIDRRDHCAIYHKHERQLQRCTHEGDHTMLSQLEPNGGWGSWSGLTQPGVQGQRAWPPSRGHGFAPTALSAAIAEVSRSIRTGNGSACSTGGGMAKAVAAATTHCVAACSGPLGAAGGDAMQVASEGAGRDPADDGHGFMDWSNEDRGVSGNPAPDRGLWD